MSEPPILGLGEPTVSKRPDLPNSRPPGVARASGQRQGERLDQKFQLLIDALEAGRVGVEEDEDLESDPELVVVLELAGPVDEFCNAVENVEGLEFLAELAGDSVDPDDDFHVVSDNERTEDPVRNSFQIFFSNTAAAYELVRLFQIWKTDEKAAMPAKLGRFKQVFPLIRDIRRWNAMDRIAETGLLKTWKEDLAVVGDSASPIDVEVELWFRNDPQLRSTSAAAVAKLVTEAGGSVLADSVIPDIRYHALLAELPRQSVESVVNDGPGSIELLDADQIMFVSPHQGMAVSSPEGEADSSVATTEAATNLGLPRIAILDGLPLSNHDLLRDRLIVDDPDELGANYAAASRRHGTAMASLIAHGDLNAGEEPTGRGLYVRPILAPSEFDSNWECVPRGQIFVDLLHRAVRRIFEGDGSQGPSAPSVRILNLSIGSAGDAFVRRMSAAGRLLDWLAFKYNVLIVVSAGNHDHPLQISLADATDETKARAAAHRASASTSRRRGVLSPGEAMNALTVGASHEDHTDVELPVGVWDVTEVGLPSHFSSTGPGFRRSIKPEIFAPGGRSVYAAPLPNNPTDPFELVTAAAAELGQKVAAPTSSGVSNGTALITGTSNAAALTTRAADRLFDLLELTVVDGDDLTLPGAEFHPVLARALLIHASRWGHRSDELKRILDLDTASARRKLTELLGYGNLDESLVGSNSPSRAVLVAGAAIRRDEGHTYEIPLPGSLRAVADLRTITATLAYFDPTAGHLSKYKNARVFFEKFPEDAIGAKRIEADHNSVRRGTCQHEVFAGSKSIAFSDGATFPLKISCMRDARNLKKDTPLRYAVVVSIEVAASTSVTVFQEVRDQLRARARAETRQAVRGR